MTDKKMRINPDIKKILLNLEKLLQTPSVTGNTSEIIHLLEDQFKKMGYATQVLPKGGLLVTIRGGQGNGIAFLAHVDTLGAVVKEIKGTGRLKLSKVGGYMMNAVEGENCLVETLDRRRYSGTILTTQSSTHIFNEATKLERNEANMEIRLDEQVHGAADVAKLGIAVGDFVSFDPRTIITPAGFIKSRHLDDKASVAALVAAADILRSAPVISNRDEEPIYFFITVHEEIGHGASAGLPVDVGTVLAVDMGVAGEGQTSDEYSVCICAKDSSGPYDLELRRYLTSLCEKYRIPYKVDVYSYYGSDAGAALRAGRDVRTGLFGPGVNASHAYERTHKDAIEATVKLIVAAVLEPFRS
ncbi:MAG: M42 family metallopeptidase [Bacillota bacterium]|jgi:putative aminopeptidase FrvX